MARVKLGIVLLAALGASAALAEPPVALSPADRAAALEAGATRNDGELPINGAHRGVHGEVGVEIGTGGRQALYGTTVVPLGQTGTAAFSFLTSRQNGRWSR
ncbi:hypothetical protein [Sphingomonas bacterium]|uniref:hypothetical protein n=1 Tax=Sphingomonas bacterium TaxID=1895847 RepID=UPI001576EB53|nr:hypothetical protein [Sphingomonas bacterium]